jgi:hypothetical protein
MKKYALLASLLFACNPPAGDPNADRNGDGIADPTGVRGVDVVNQQAPSSPVGVVVGTLRDAYTGAPIADQVITVASGPGITLTATTDANGAFTIDSVAFGYYGFNIVREGYVPVATVFENELNDDLGEFPTDNYVNNLGDVYLLPSDSTMAISVVTASGLPVANKEIIVEVGMTVLRNGDFVGTGSGVYGSRTILSTTDAAGVATVTGVPDVTKLARAIAQGNDYQIYVISGPVDVNGDGIYDYAGRGGSPSVNLAQNGRAKFTFILNPATSDDEPQISASNTSFNNGTRPAQILPSEPIRFVFDQPILPGSIIAAVTNDFPRLTNGGRVFDNSSVGYDRENNPEPALNVSTSNNTLAATLDPSGQVLTLTPSAAWPAGRVLFVNLMVSSAQASGDAGASNLFRTFAYVKPAADALTVEQTLLERAKVSPANGFKYGTLVIGFNQPVQPSSDGIFYCIDADLNNNGSRETNFVLDANECPLATSTRALNSADVAGLKRFERADGSNPPSATRWFEADLAGEVPAFPNLDLNGGVSKLPDVYLLINPIVNGTFVDPDNTNQVLVDAYGRPLASQRVKVVFDVATSTLSQAPVGGAALIANN